MWFCGRLFCGPDGSWWLVFRTFEMLYKFYKCTNVIYAITCPTCGSFYIGQTQDLRKRVTLHKQQIHHEEYRHLYVSNHLYHCSKGKFNIAPIYQCKDSNRLVLESKEQLIINILQPDLNK